MPGAPPAVEAGHQRAVEEDQVSHGAVSVHAVSAAKSEGLGSRPAACLRRRPGRWLALPRASWLRPALLDRRPSAISLQQFGGHRERERDRLAGAGELQRLDSAAGFGSFCACMLRRARGARGRRRAGCSRGLFVARLGAKRAGDAAVDVPAAANHLTAGSCSRSRPAACAWLASTSKRPTAHALLPARCRSRAPSFRCCW